MPVSRHHLSHCREIFKLRKIILPLTEFQVSKFSLQVLETPRLVQDLYLKYLIPAYVEEEGSTIRSLSQTPTIIVVYKTQKCLEDLENAVIFFCSEKAWHVSQGNKRRDSCVVGSNIMTQQ